MNPKAESMFSWISPCDLGALLGEGNELKSFSACLEQSLGQILEAAVSVGSRTLEVQLDALLATLHTQVGWGRG